MPKPVRKPAVDPVIDVSTSLLHRARAVIPCATQTLAKGPAQYVEGIAPNYLQRGKGSHVWDVDGNEYIDCTMAVGPISLGYAFDEVDDAIRAQLEDGITFSLMHPLEVEVAELVREVVPNVEAVRFSKTGCDVTSAAVRLARAFTGRSTILCCGYHGWHDWYIGVTDRNAGIPQDVRDKTFTFAYNDIQSVYDAIDDDTAAIILEPMVFDVPTQNFLGELRQICDQRGIVLIFDEMWTGFRMSLGGAQELFGVKADLMCFSKAIANGMPVSVLAGRADIMSLLEHDVFFFTTFGGEALSLAAAKATIDVMRKRDVIGTISRTGVMLRDGYNRIAAECGITYSRAKGHPSRSIIMFDATATDPLLMKSFVQQEMIRRGILWGGFHNVSYSHTPTDVQRILEAYRDVLPRLDQAVRSGTLATEVRGIPVAPVFRRTSNFNMKPKRREVAA
ncbi:MAG: aminotransferase class III-fold pyridoxal phosphate-dependent enzyme [Candidatus Kapabacteria bacterium]|nr:aminotransferase class III-fold pyridoxal phosphate-dependent enzyme [Candidatus Kapabacteria bacterium]